MRRIASVAVALAASILPAAACIPMPAEYVTARPGSEAHRNHVEREGYIVRRLSEGRPFATIVFGDSIMGGWRFEMVEGLFGGPMLHAARGGATTKDLHRYLDTWPLAAQNPATIFLDIGRNDLGQDVCPAPAAAAVLDVLARLRGMFPASRIIWQNSPPGGEYLRLKAFDVRELNRIVAAGLPALNIELFDVWSVVYRECAGVRYCRLFLAGDEYKGGPVHFGPYGYEVFYGAAKSSLTP